MQAATGERHAAGNRHRRHRDLARLHRLCPGPGLRGKRDAQHPARLGARVRRASIGRPSQGPTMPTPAPIDYKDASAEVRAVFDDIKRSRNVPDVNNFWKYLARDPALLRRTWESVKEVMAPGALDPLTKEM